MLKIITKSAAFSSAMFGLWSLGAKLASAQAKCMVNGREVPCEELGRQVKGFLGWGIGIFLFMFALGIAATIFWIMMIVHAAKNNVDNKAMWIILMVFTGIIGALIYYFAVKRNFAKQPPPAPATPGATPPPSA